MPHLDRHRIITFAHFSWRRFLEENCLQTAGALAYTTLFALVPLIAVLLGILAAFPVFAQWREQITQFVFSNFVPATGDVVSSYLTQFADNASKATAIGILLLLFSAVMLMLSIEDAFNRIWRVRSGRPTATRLIAHWAVLTLGPLLVVAAVVVSSYLLALPLLDAVDAEFSLKAHLLGWLPFLIQWVVLALAYTLIPHRQVRVRDAMIGALIAALLFEAAKRGFAAYVTHGTNYQQVYGALAIIPIFIAWIYLSWVLVLLGASLTAAFAAFDYHPHATRLAPGEEFRGLIRVLAHFAVAHRASSAMASSELSEREPFLTDDLIQRHLGDLERTGFIQRTEKGDWVLTRDLASISLFDLYAASGYRLPLGAPLPGGTALDAKATDLLAAAAQQLRIALRSPLTEIFPAPVRSDKDEVSESIEEKP